MLHHAFALSGENAVPVRLTTEERWPALAAELDPIGRAYAEAIGFDGKAGSLAPVPDASGAVGSVLVGMGAKDATDPFDLARLATSLPEGTYRLADPPDEPALAALGFALGSYRFDRYRERPGKDVRLLLPEGVDGEELSRIAQAVAMGRDLINTPANDLGPDGIEEAARRLAERHGAEIRVTTGDDLLDADLPMIHAVGRAAERAPRLVDMVWGEQGAPPVTLVGKGVAFDTGGLDIKPSSAMLLMKKDMGGAATALALADMVMGAGLKLRLRVLIPAVENAISGASFRPGDVLRSRKGLSVEIGNTDAEGRLILADALALADEEAPELMVDFATLTGAARVALGPELPPFYTRDDVLAEDVARLARTVRDPVWRLPLWQPYGKMLESKIADTSNVSSGGFAGSITAALFLARFVTAARAYLHFDIYGWNPSAKPARPEGGEVQAARLVYALLKERYPAS
ncbi:leucyl aminopeptidase family protein [Enterovirga aerilata]|uniref:Leucyl aminopeptidase family protein n=1 Tax=Enterovirga aerilata TaxID=2730920 RepID=A0A849I8L8_9HYPH|nr:leucyl aminopeptidase family protein [Enterovirga sp. DB1703]NNM73661.1 leucyl aminopeptidase family protein [Enterovirga sp. DB1703]